MPIYNPLVFLILDGWGYSHEKSHNAIAKAHTPQWDKWWKSCPHILLDASGQSVGLPHEQMGNSEVGHMHIGAGRIIPQDFTRINQSIDNDQLVENKTLNASTSALQQSPSSALHLMGLFSDGGVHSHEKHLYALLDFYAAQINNPIQLHLFLDGRDTAPKSALDKIKQLEEYISKHKTISIASITGRFYAMDRDNRWERIQKTYTVLTTSVDAPHHDYASTALSTYYQDGITDEFIPPTQIGASQLIKHGDSVLFFNFRADRARQLTQAFIEKEFTAFPIKKPLNLNQFLTMTSYSKDFSTQVIFPSIEIKNTLGEMIANAGLKQFRIAETEKYAHVTFFLNGGREQCFTNESRQLVPSPQVTTYDLKPEMSAQELTDAIIDTLMAGETDIIICNYANADMVGHTGDIEATVKAIEAIDDSLKQIEDAVQAQNGRILITADHGNAECLFNPESNQPHTAHTINPVPLLFVGQNWYFKAETGTLTDVAPTILSLLNITPPKEMTGSNLMGCSHEV